MSWGSLHSMRNSRRSLSAAEGHTCAWAGLLPPASSCAGVPAHPWGAQVPGDREPRGRTRGVGLSSGAGHHLLCDGRASAVAGESTMPESPPHRLPRCAPGPRPRPRGIARLGARLHRQGCADKPTRQMAPELAARRGAHLLPAAGPAREAGDPARGQRGAPRLSTRGRPRRSQGARSHHAPSLIVKVIEKSVVSNNGIAEVALNK